MSETRPSADGVLAAITERAEHAKSPVISGNVYVYFLSGDIEWLLARVGQLEQRIKELEQRIGICSGSCRRLELDDDC